MLSGETTQYTKLVTDQAKAQKDAADKADEAKSRFSALAGTGGGGGFGGGGGGMGALIGVGAALAPVIATVGTGLLGLGAAAYGIYKPISNASQATGGLTANLHKLNPEQQAVARGILGLGQDFAGFQKQLQPTVLGLFSRGLQLAAVLLHGVEPVAAATGKALGQVLGQVSATFQDGTWQQFFGFMRQTATPDVALLGKTFTDLLNALPPLVEQLQPLSQALLVTADDAVKAAGGLAKFIGTAEQKFPLSTQNTFGWLHKLDAWSANLENKIPGIKQVSHGLTDVQHAFGQAGPTAAAAATSITSAGQAALVSGPKFFSFSKAVATLNTDMTKLVGNLLTLQGNELSWQQSLQSAQAQLKSNTAGLEGNSKNALANRQAVLQSTQAALTFASNQLTLGKNIGQASRTVQDQINWLQKLHDKSQFVRQEIEALRKEEQLLQQQRINQIINVQGLGHWQVSQSLAPGVGHRRAMGGLIPGSGTGDSYPALLTPGELVVPKGMVSAGAVDHLRGSLPGFASGGLVPSYKGSLGGLSPWIQGNDTATIRLIDLAVVKATVAGIRAAEAAARAVAGAPGGKGGPANAGAAQAQAYARSRLAAYGWSGGQMPPLIALWNGESGWNRLARNPTSGAYGIPQALPASKMGAAANPPTSSAAAQINWGMGYIKSVYSTPGNAYSTWLSRSPHWYDNPAGTLMPPGLSLAYNGTGRPEMLVPQRAGVPRMVLEIHASDSETSQFLVGLLRKHVRVAGGGDVQVALGRR